MDSINFCRSDAMNADKHSQICHRIANIVTAMNHALKQELGASTALSYRRLVTLSAKQLAEILAALEDGDRVHV